MFRYDFTAINSLNSFVLEGTIVNMYQDGIDISVTKVTCPSQQWLDRMGSTLLSLKADDGTHFTQNPFSSKAMSDGEKTILYPVSPQSYQKKCEHIHSI